MIDSILSIMDPVPDPTVEAYRLLIADVAELLGRSRATSDAMARRSGQTVARWHLMSVISDGPRSVSAAARRLGLTRQSVQRVADDLVAGGLAIATPDPTDNRAPRLGLTPTGRRVVTRLYSESERSRAELIDRSGLSDRDLLAAGQVIRALIVQFGLEHP